MRSNAALIVLVCVLSFSGSWAFLALHHAVVSNGNVDAATEAIGIRKAKSVALPLTDRSPDSARNLAALNSPTRRASSPNTSESERLRREASNSTPDVESLIAQLRDTGLSRQAATEVVAKLAAAGVGNDRVLEAIMEYVRRPVEWSKVGDLNAISGLRVAKTQALSQIGIIGTPMAEQTLRYAMTAKGAQDLTNAWFPTMPDPRILQDGDPLGEFRGFAARGLAQFGDRPEIHNLIATAHAQERKRLVDAGRQTGAYFNQLVDSMVLMDVIRDYGRIPSQGAGSYHNLWIQYAIQGGYTITPITPGFVTD